jgi:membrane protease YdiL (CAAX protease family)
VIRLQSRLLPWGLKDFSKLYAVAAVYYVIGSLVPILLIFGCVIAALHIAPEKMVDVVATADGHPNMHVVLAATLASFLCGFGAELYYINKQLRKEGLSLAKAIGLNLDSLHGSWGEAFKRAIIGLGAGLVIQNMLDMIPIPKPHQQTADMAANLDGGGMVGFIILAAIMAPFFEEIIFRGFVFNAFRNIFSEGRIFKLIGENKRVGDYAAIGFSSLLFAAAHMDASAFIHLFAVGVVLAEVYRRSGSLVVPMLLHAGNNLIATIIIVSSSAAPAAQEQVAQAVDANSHAPHQTIERHVVR